MAREHSLSDAMNGQIGDLVGLENRSGLRASEKDRSQKRQCGRLARVRLGARMNVDGDAAIF